MTIGAYSVTGMNCLIHAPKPLGRIALGRDPAAALARANDALAKLSGTLGALAAPDDFLTGKLQPEQADVCSFSFVKFLMADRRFGNLLQA